MAPGLPEFEVTCGNKEWLLSANGQWDGAIGRGSFQDQSQVLLPGLKYSTITTNVRYLTLDYLDFFVIWLNNPQIFFFLVALSPHSHAFKHLDAMFLLFVVMLSA